MTAYKRVSTFQVAARDPYPFKHELFELTTPLLIIINTLITQHWM
jgi:hypothetical protein